MTFACSVMVGGGMWVVIQVAYPSCVTICETHIQKRLM